MHKPENVDQYIADFPADIQQKLKEMRACIKKAAPNAEEGISYGMPAYKQNGVLVYFGGFTKHVSLFPTGKGVAAFVDKLQGYTISKGTIQFPLDSPLPVKLISEIVAFRVEENLQKQKKKK